MEFLSSDSEDSDKGSMVIVRPEDVTNVVPTYYEKVNENQYLKKSSNIGEAKQVSFGEKVFDRANLDKSMIIGGEKESVHYISPMTRDNFEDNRNLTELAPHKNPLFKDKQNREVIDKRNSLPEFNQPITGDLSEDNKFHNQRFSYDANRQIPSTDPGHLMSSFSQSHDTKNSSELKGNSKKPSKPVSNEEFDEFLRIPIQTTHTRRDTGFGLRSQDNLLPSQYINPKQDNSVDDTHRDVRYGLSPQVNLQSNTNKQETRRDTG
ncbi:4010_t:CDS:2, partial [Funneliformis caledonium]